MGAQKTLLVTRPAPDNRETARLLQKAGFNVELLPLLEFKALDFELPASEEFAAIAVTSTNALRALKQKNALKNFFHLPLFAVGQKTAKQAETLGFANVRAANGNLLSLVDLIKASRLKGTLFYPAARQLSGDLGSMLGQKELIVRTVPIYEMAALKQLSTSQSTMLEDGSIDASLFYSRRTAETFLSLCDLYALNARTLPVLCLSPNVADIFQQAGFRQIHLSSAPNQQAMIALALSFVPINSK